MPTRSPIETVRFLHRTHIQFVVVGGVAAVLNGAPITTYDVDVVHSREPENVDRLLSALEEIDAIFRIQPERRLRPAASHLAGAGHVNLLTSYGPIDFRGTIGDGLGYEELLPQSIEMDIGEGMRIHVLNLEALIALKEQ